MTMHDERYIMTINEGHDGVSLHDRKTGETSSFTGARAPYDALALLAEWRERDQAARTDMPSVVIDGEGDRWTLQSDGLYAMAVGFRRSLDSIREIYGIQEKSPMLVIDCDDDVWTLQGDGLYEYRGAGGVQMTRSLADIRNAYGIRETR